MVNPMRVGQVNRAQERKELRLILKNYRRLHDGELDSYIYGSAKRISKKLTRSVREK